MALATLSIDLVAKLANFERDLGAAARATEKSAARMSAAFGTIKSAIGGLAGGIGVAGLVALTRSAINSLDALNDLKDATGATVENISALEDIAARTGTSFDTVGTSLIKFNQALGNAKPGGDVAAAFAALNLNVRELQSLDPAEALRRVAVALNGFADDGNKARLTQELFGKSLREVAPFLKDLAEAGKLVGTVTAKQVEEAEKFNKELFAMQKNMQDIKRQAVSPLVSAFNDLIKKMREAEAAGGSWLRVYMNQVRAIYGLAPTESGGAGGASGSWWEGNAGRGLVNPAAVRPSVGSLPDAVKKAKGAGGASSGPEGTRNATSELSRYAEQLARASEKTLELSAVETARLRIAENLSRFTSPLLQQQILADAQRIDDAKELNAELEKRLEIDKQIYAAEDQYRRMVQELDDTLRDLSGRSGDDRKRALTGQLEAQLNAGVTYTPEELDRIVRGIGGVNEEIVKSKSLVDELGLSFTSAFEDAVVGGKKFSEVLQGLEQDILRIVTRKLVTEPLGNAVSGLFSSGGGIGSGLASIFGGLFKADGGPVRAGGSYIVGERGPELFRPSSNGTIIPNGAGGGRSVIITVNQSFAAGTSRSTVMQAAADARRQLELGGRNL